MLDPAGLTDNVVQARLIAAIERYGDELDDLRGWAGNRNDRAFFPEKGMYDWFESQVLYLLLRITRPRLVVEISPGYGYSTGFMLLALNRNAFGMLLSFDVRALHERACRALAHGGIDASRWRFVAGNARRTVPGALPAGRSIDVLFMDSDHSASFADWYLEALVPRVRPGGLIHVHDVLRHGVPPQVVDEGEGKAVWDYLVRNRIPEDSFVYIAELVRSQPVSPEPIQRLTRYPFDDPRVATDGVEQNPSLWFAAS